MRKYIAEFVGTGILVFFAVGSAVAGINVIGAVGVALAFGFVLLALAYSIGPVSGCHVNPAVTVGLLVARKITGTDAAGYIIAQVLGGIAGAAFLKGMVAWGGVKDQTGGLGTNDYGEAINLGGALVLEVILTFLLVLVVLLVTGKAASPGAAGTAIGLALAVIHLVGIPLTGTSVNPARSIGPALFNGGDSLAHLWVFILAPLVGGVLAALLWPVIRAAADGPEPGTTPVAAEPTTRAEGQGPMTEPHSKTA